MDVVESTGRQHLLQNIGNPSKILWCLNIHYYFLITCVYRNAYNTIATAKSLYPFELVALLALRDLYMAMIATNVIGVAL